MAIFIGKRTFLVVVFIGKCTCYQKNIIFAYKILVSLFYWKQHFKGSFFIEDVVICFHFSIFVLLETAL